MTQNYSKYLILCTVFLNSLLTPAVGSDELKAQTQQHHSFPGIHKVDEDFYYGKMRSPAGKALWLVMEKVNDYNHSLFSNYIKVQSNLRAVNFGCSLKDKDGNLFQKGTTADGSKHFQSVLKEVSYLDNEVWVAYISRSNMTPKKITAQDLLGYSAENLRSPLNKFANDIEMFVTVTSSPNGEVTSHMGVASTIEGVTTRQKGTSVDLHSFAAKVMLMRNPARRFMINAPVFEMEQIIAKALPNSTFVGTREMRAKMQQNQSVTFDEFKTLKGNEIKENLRQGGIKEADRANSSLQRDLRLLSEGEINGFTEESLRDKAIKRYVSTQGLVEMGNEGLFVVSEAKVESQYLEALNSEFINFRNSYVFSPAKTKETMSEEFLKFMEKHPPMLSVKWQGDQKVFTFFDPKRPETPWLTIDDTNFSDYNWIFQNPFQPAGITHFMVVDLVALAHSKPLIEVVNQEDLEDPEGKVLKSLKNNSSVVDLTIHTNAKKPDTMRYDEYAQLLLDSFCNKPNLKKLTIVGNFDVDLFFNSSNVCMGNQLDIDPLAFLVRPRLSFFANLEELTINGHILGANRNPAYFYTNFFRQLTERGKLKKFTTTDASFRSFDISKPN